MWARGVDAESVASHYAKHALGLTKTESQVLFSGGWMPIEGMTVPEVLRKLADDPTSSVLDMTNEHSFNAEEMDHFRYSENFDQGEFDEFYALTSFQRSRRMSFLSAVQAHEDYPSRKKA